MKVAPRVRLLVQLDQGARLEHLLDQALVLGRRSVAPVDGLRLGDPGALVYPLLEGRQHIDDTIIYP